MIILSEIGNTPVDFAVLKSIFPDHKSVHNKISELEKSGTLIRLKKGMYVVSPKENGKLLSVELIANHLYVPAARIVALYNQNRHTLFNFLPNILLYKINAV